MVLHFLFQSALEIFGHIDILVNNAAYRMRRR